jgi:hypothetical protein
MTEREVSPRGVRPSKGVFRFSERDLGLLKLPEDLHTACSQPCASYEAGPGFLFEANELALVSLGDHDLLGSLRTPR